MIRIKLLISIFLSCTFLGFFHNAMGQHHYKTTLFRAAPGMLLSLLDFLKNSPDEIYLMRHSQGDHWDLMLIEPVRDYGNYFSETINFSSFGSELHEMVAYKEELFVSGPDLELFESKYKNNEFYHIEMFVALPGKQSELLKEREMENEYLKYIGRPQNLIFTKDFGSKWDVYTIGFYENIQEFAGSENIPEDKEEAAAKKAGFEAADRIGTYLRTLISLHHDTLAVKVE